MTQEIKLSGLAAIPDDYQAQDGALDVAINLIPEDGQIKPLSRPKEICAFPHGYQVIFLHDTVTIKNYILLDKDANKIYWINAEDAHGTLEPDTLNLIHDFGSVTVLQVNTVGNTLCTLCSDGLHYILWRPDNTAYSYLGQKPEMIELSFGLSAEKKAAYDTAGIEWTDPAATFYSAWIKAGDYTPDHFLITNTNHTVLMFKDDMIDDLNQTIYALINKTNALITKEGHFYAPFFVRYCYRLYDGSTWMHSAPIFMPVAMPFAYQVELPTLVTKDGTTIEQTARPYIIDEDLGKIALNNLYFRYRPHNVALEFKCIGGNVTNLREIWGDIIKYIDIFVSSPIIREDESEKIKTASIANYSYNLSHKTINGADYPGVLSMKEYSVISDSSHYDDWMNDMHTIICNIPLLSEESYLDKINSVSSFYKIASYDLETDIIPTNGFEEVRIDKSMLPRLTTQEVLKDDYKSHNIISPIVEKGKLVTKLFNNNKRFYITAPKERLFNGFHIGALIPYGQQVLGSYVGENTIKFFNVKKIITYLRTDEGERIVKWEDNNGFGLISTVIEQSPLFYPDDRAYKMEIYATVGQKYYKLEFDMRPCAMFNGASTKGGIFKSINDTTSTRTESNSEFPSVSTKPYISYSSKIYFSEVNNPFIFPPTNINTIGTGTIRSLATVTEPLSQGQFGYADIYIFSSDGIWVAQINQEGKITNINPVNKDVCTNPESITQLGSSILYATQRGIMQIYGRHVKCISDIIATEHPFNHLSALPKLSTITNLSIAPFSEFLSDCRILYDYIHQRIIVYNPLQDEHRHEHQRTIGGLFDPTTGTYTPVTTEIYYTYTYTPHFHYAYVFSLRSNLWGMMDSNLASSLNSYPECLAMDQDNNLVSFDNPATDTPVSSIAITRPIKFGSPDTLKSVYELIQRGVFNRGDVKTILYGSRDLEHWYLIASSTSHAIRGLRGTPYKYFRLVAVSSLADNQSLAGTTFVVEPRHIHQLH